MLYVAPILIRNPTSAPVFVTSRGIVAGEFWDTLSLL